MRGQFHGIGTCSLGNSDHILVVAKRTLKQGAKSIHQTKPTTTAIREGRGTNLAFVRGWHSGITDARSLSASWNILGSGYNSIHAVTVPTWSPCFSSSDKNRLRSSVLGFAGRTLPRTKRMDTKAGLITPPCPAYSSDLVTTTLPL